jgi:cytochrome P450
MSSTTGEDLPTFPVPRRSPLRPPPEFARWRAEEPVRKVTLSEGRWAWLITRYEDARTVLADTRFSSESVREGFPTTQPEDIDAVPGAFLSLDPPEHTTLRRMLTGEFTVRQIARLRPAVERAARELTDALAWQGSPADLVARFALPLPVMVICELLGVPFADRAFFQERGQTIGSLTAPAREVDEALKELGDYLRRLLRAKDAAPRDDLLSRLVVEHVRTGRASWEQAVGMAMVLLVAGHDPASKTIGLGSVLLLKRPDRLAELREEPSLWPAAVEEMLRYLSAFHTGFRLALADVSVGGVTIRAGEGVLVALASANRDADAFADPERLDFRRGARHHLGFGYGIHQCLGQHLARLELQTALRTLFEELPSLRLTTEPEGLRWQEQGVAEGVRTVPVAW